LLKKLTFHPYSLTNPQISSYSGGIRQVQAISPGFGGVVDQGKVLEPIGSETFLPRSDAKTAAPEDPGAVVLPHERGALALWRAG